VFATILYAVQFYRKKHNHYFYLILAIDMTILTHFYTQSVFITSLAAAETILLIMIFTSMIKASRKNKILEKNRQNAVPPQEDNGKHDFIDEAFSDKP
jgi:predicted membrane protein